LKTARHAHVQFERRFDAVAEFTDAREIRAIFIAHRQVVQEVFDGRFARLAFAVKRRERETETARGRLAETRDAVPCQREDRSVERKGHKSSDK
jgi:hypothetical protein